MAKERHRVYIACYLYLKKDGKVLLSRRFNAAYQNGNYTMVSGHIEEGENAITAMAREAKEEAGIDIALDDLRVVHLVQRLGPDREYVDFYLTADKWKGEPRNMEPDKCDDLGWFDFNKLPKNIVGYIPVVIRKIEAGQIYTQYDEREELKARGA